MSSYQNAIVPILKKTIDERLKGLCKENGSLLSYDNRFNAHSPFTKSYDFNLEEFEVLFPEHVSGVNELLFSDFMEIVKKCKEHGIMLIMFTAPEDEQYSRVQMDSQKIKSIYHTIIKKNENSAYLDYTLGGDCYDKSFELLLKDSHHINEKGLFSEILLVDIKNIIKNRL